MIINILFICVYFFEMLIAAVFFGSISEKKKPLYLILICGTLMFEVGALFAILIVNTAWVNVLFSITATFLLALLFFEIKPIRALFYSVILVAVSSILEHIVIFFISSMSNLKIAEYESETVLLVIEIIISKTMYFFAAMLLSRFMQKDKSIIKIPAAFYIFPAITLISVECFWYISISQYLEYKNQIVLGIVSILLLLATLVVYFAFQSNAKKENELLMLQQEQRKIKTDIAYYDILEQQNNNLRAYAHDAKNHLAAIKSLNTDTEIDGYISKMLESLAEYSKVCHSGNRTLDVIIDKYVTECKINGLNFEFDLNNNNLSGMQPYDIVSVLGNLLDNAVEAAKNAETKTVRIETEIRNDYSVIIVSNSCDTPPKLNKTELPITTKTDEKLHGFGLKSVKKTLKKYGGDIVFDYDGSSRLLFVTVMVGECEGK